MSYYYLVSSLPAIRPDGPLPLSTARFRTLCSEHLEPRHLAELDAVLAGGGSSEFALAWRRIEATIARQTALARAPRYGADPAAFADLPGAPDLTLVHGIAGALAAGDPLSRERQLDMLRLARLEELAFGRRFEMDGVLAYGLELGIRTRWAGRTPEAGQQRLAARVGDMLQAFDAGGDAR